jgi:hypothetical protein
LLKLTLIITFLRVYIDINYFSGSHLILNELFLFSKRLTACEALNYGLVTTVIWSDKFYETILPKVAKLALT